MRITPSLPLFPGRLLPRMVVPDGALSMGWIELHTYAKTELFELELFD